MVARGWSFWQIFCTQFVTQVSSATFVVALHLCVFDDDGVLYDNDDDDDDDGNDDEDDDEGNDDDDDDDGNFVDDDEENDVIGDDNNDDNNIIRCGRYLKQTTLRSSTLEALEIIYLPSARFVLPPSASPRLHSLPQRHLLLLRLHGVQRLLGRHAPQRHQQRERRRHQHNRHLELGRVPRPLVDVGENIVT